MKNLEVLNVNMDEVLEILTVDAYWHSDSLC